MNLSLKVRERLGADYCVSDEAIEGYIDEIVSKIKSICNRNDLPKELEYLVIRYAINCAVVNKNGYGEGKQILSSLSDQGQSVSYKNISAISEENVDLDRYIEKNFDEISMYAYMRW